MTASATLLALTPCLLDPPPRPPAQPLVEILVDWKWVHFVRPAFFRNLALYILHLVFVMFWNVEASQTALLPLAMLLGQDEGGSGAAEVWLLFLWGWTSFAVLVIAWTEFRKLRDVGTYSYFKNIYSLLDVFYVCFQARRPRPHPRPPTAHQRRTRWPCVLLGVYVYADCRLVHVCA